MDYTKIITTFIAFVAALLSAFIVPYLKEKIGSDKLKKWQLIVETAVRAAEQLYNSDQGQEKKAYVLQYLASKGIKFDDETVDKMIESAVLMLHHELYGSSSNQQKDGESA